MSVALALVPPMSKEMRSPIPSRRPTATAEITPAAGPDSTITAGSRATVAARAIPPLDCITDNGAPMPRACRASSIRDMYSLTLGATAPCTAAVLKRSYSRYSRQTEWLVITGTSVHPLASSATASSCCG